VRPVRKADKLTGICEPTVYTRWDPQHLTTLQAYTASYGESFTCYELCIIHNILQHPAVLCVFQFRVLTLPSVRATWRYIHIHTSTPSFLVSIQHYIFRPKWPSSCVLYIESKERAAVLSSKMLLKQLHKTQKGYNQHINKTYTRHANTNKVTTAC
jgi:hypothetical protein